MLQFIGDGSPLKYIHALADNGGATSVYDVVTEYSAYVVGYDAVIAHDEEILDDAIDDEIDMVVQYKYSGVFNTYEADIQWDALIDWEAHEPDVENGTKFKFPR